MLRSYKLESRLERNGLERNRMHRIGYTKHGNE